MNIKQRIRQSCLTMVVTLCCLFASPLSAEIAAITLPREFYGDLPSQIYPLNADDARIIRALDYLRGVQQADGRIAAFATSAWAVMAIAAAGEEPHNWAVDGTSVVDYLRNKAVYLDTNKATDWERAILAIVAAGESPRDFGGIDHVEALLNLYDGTQMGDAALLNDDFWGILALASIGESPEAIQNIRSFIIANQNADGGWGWTVGGNSDADNTAAAVSALVAAGEPSGSPAITGALDYLKSQQQSNGSFISEGTVNTAANSWAINAIVDVDQSPVGDAWSQGGNNPVGYLLSLQDTDGAFRWSASQRSNPEWMTSYVLIALLGKSWPRDTLPPVMSDVDPSPGAVLAPGNISISASYTDTVSGIDGTTIRIILDGTDVTAGAAVTDSDISYAANGLSAGNHTISVIVKDNCNNEANQDWSFEIIDSVIIDDSPPLPPPQPGKTIVKDIISGGGIFIDAATADSADGKCILIIDKGINGLTESGKPLSWIKIEEVEPPPPPVQTKIVGLVYDLSPDGATFDPPAGLSLTYDPAEIPAGVDENNLVIGIRDGISGNWEEMPGIVNTVDHIITAPVSHFTDFTVLAHTRPASFTVRELSITPAEATAGESINIGAIVTNTGDIQGSYEVKLKIDGEVVEIRPVTLAGNSNCPITFTITKDTAGSYPVEIHGLSGKFLIKEIAPEPSLLPTPAETPAAPQDPPPVLQPSPVSQPSPSRQINWSLIVIIIAGAIAAGSVGVVVFYFFKGEIR